MADPVQSVKELTTKMNQEVIAKMKADAAQVADVTGENSNKVKASSSGKMYTLNPVSMKKLPMLVSKIEEIQKIMSEVPEGQSDTEVMTANEGKMMVLMSECIAMGIKEDITADQVMDEFSIGDFPKCLEKIYDMNDFLSGMRNVYQKRMKAM